jgi:ribosomal protein S26
LNAYRSKYLLEVPHIHYAKIPEKPMKSAEHLSLLAPQDCVVYRMGRKNIVGSCRYVKESGVSVMPKHRVPLRQSACGFLVSSTMFAVGRFRKMRSVENRRMTRPVATDWNAPRFPRQR